MLSLTYIFFSFFFLFGFYSSFLFAEHSPSHSIDLQSVSTLAMMYFKAHIKRTRTSNIPEGTKANMTKMETYDNILDEEDVVATFRIDSKVTGADALIGFL